jgi:hypothetical protein
MKATMIPVIALVGGALAILAPDCRSEVPRVEMNFNKMAAGQWSGKRFNEIISPDRIQRIILLAEHGFAHHSNRLPDYEKLVQADYDALVAHLLKSEEPAQDYSLDAQEGKAARLLFVTTDNQVFEVEVLSRANRDVTAIMISGPGFGARIDVKGYQRAAQRK